MMVKMCDLCKYQFVGQEVVYFISSGFSKGLFNKQKADVCNECYKKVVSYIGSLKK